MLKYGSCTAIGTAGALSGTGCAQHTELAINQQSHAQRMMRSSGTTVVRFVRSIIDACALAATFLWTWIANFLAISFRRPTAGHGVGSDRVSGGHGD